MILLRDLQNKIRTSNSWLLVLLCKRMMLDWMFLLLVSGMLKLMAIVQYNGKIKQCFVLSMFLDVVFEKNDRENSYAQFSLKDHTTLINT